MFLFLLAAIIGTPFALNQYNFSQVESEKLLTLPGDRATVSDLNNIRAQATSVDKLLSAPEKESSTKEHFVRYRQKSSLVDILPKSGYFVDYHQATSCAFYSKRFTAEEARAVIISIQTKLGYVVSSNDMFYFNDSFDKDLKGQTAGDSARLRLEKDKSALTLEFASEGRPELQDGFRAKLCSQDSRRL